MHRSAWNKRSAETEPGRFNAFYLVVNGAVAQDMDDALKVFDDLAEISAALQEGAARQADASQGGEQ